MANFCTACGTPNDDAAGFCHECGTAWKSAGVVASPADVQASPIPEHPAASAASSQARRSWLLPAVLGAVALIAAAGSFAWWSSPSTATAGASSSAPVEPTQLVEPRNRASIADAAADHGPVQPDVVKAAGGGRDSDATHADENGIFAAVKNLISGEDPKKLDGTYGDSMRVSTYTFKDNGTVLFSAMGMQVVYKYEVDGDTVRMFTPYGGVMVWTLLRNGSLQGPPGPIDLILTKRESASAAGPNAGGKGASGATGSVVANRSGMEAGAQDAALTELAKHLLKGPDGWTTVLTESMGPFDTPKRFLRQFREITVESVESSDLSNADRLNGFDWVGRVSITTGPCREAGDPDRAFFSIAMTSGGMMGIDRPRGRWTQWVEIHPQTLDLSRLNGVWRVEEHNLLRGKLPAADDFERAGVK